MYVILKKKLFLASLRNTIKIYSANSPFGDFEYNGSNTCNIITRLKIKCFYTYCDWFGQKILFFVKKT